MGEVLAAAALQAAGKGAVIDMSKTKKILNDAVKNKISETIAGVEKNTSGEIAVMVVEESDSYREASALGAVVFAALSAFCFSVILAVVLHHRSMWSFGTIEYLYNLMNEVVQYTSLWVFIPMMFALYFPFRALMNIFPGMKLLFVSKKREEESVRERTERAFYEKGLYRTRDETGVLIFISLLERRVWILGDRGINEKIPYGFWEKKAKELSDGMGKKKYDESICAVIRSCADELVRHFPIKPDDTNEIPNEVIT